MNQIGMIIEFYSLASVAIGLGVSNTTIGRFINTISPLASPLLELDVFIVDSSRPLTNNVVNFKDTTVLSPITDFDLYYLHRLLRTTTHIIIAPTSLSLPPSKMKG